MTEHISGIDKIADKNIRKWVLAEHVHEHLEKRTLEENIGPFVVISRDRSWRQ